MMLRSREPAGQCRELGIAVGDTIIGSEHGAGAYWHEARLTLLWLGESVAVWSTQERTNESPDWSAPHEESNWVLYCRQWRRPDGSPLTPKD